MLIAPIALAISTSLKFFLLSSTASSTLSLSESFLDVPVDEATLTGFNTGKVMASVHLIDASFNLCLIEDT